LQCIENDWQDYKHLYVSLQFDKDILVETIQSSNGLFFYQLPRVLQQDKDLLLCVLAHDYKIIHQVPIELLNNKEFVLSALSIRPKIYNQLPAHMKRDAAILAFINLK
jgi:hypothetical protein